MGKGPSESSRDRDIRKQCEQLGGIGSTLMLPPAVIRDAATILTDYRSRSALPAYEEQGGGGLDKSRPQQQPGSVREANGEETKGSGYRREQGPPAARGEVDGAAVVGKRRRWHNLPALLAAVLYVAARRAGLGLVIPEIAAAAGSDVRMVSIHYR